MGIGKEVISKLLERENKVHLYSRSVPEESIANSSLLSHVPYDVNGDFPIETLPESIDGYIYFPGSINLRPFERLSIDDFTNDLNRWII